MLNQNLLAMDNHPSKSDSVNESRMMSLSEMAKIMKGRPPQKLIYSGIKENSIGFVFGPGKSGKTTFCENLGMSIAAGESTFLGKPINVENRKVLVYSLEEFCDGRFERNTKQAEILNEKYGTDWHENYIIGGCDVIRYVSSDADWQLIKDEIASHKPGIVILDSLSRLHGGDNIEDSQVAQRVMKKLRELVNEFDTTVIVIHHTPKLSPGMPLTIFNMAGSRILGQEADFVIGINKTADKKIYLKDVAFRYAPDNEDKVKVLGMDSSQWMNHIKDDEEARLLQAFDGRRDDTSKMRITDFIEEHSQLSGSSGIKSAELEKGLIDKTLSRGTLYNHLKSLALEGIIIREDTGVYRMAA